MKDVQLKGEFKELFKHRPFLINLLILIIAWITSSFDWYLIGFQLDNIGGSIFINTYISAASDLIVTLLSGIIYYYIGIKLSFIILFLISGVGGIINMVVQTDNDYGIALMLLIAKFGVGGTFTLVFLSIAHLYPSVLATTTFGICNVCARMATIAAPLVAELDKVYSNLIFTILAISSAILCLFIIEPKKNDW